MKIINLIIIFWIFSVLGWLLEELAFLIEDKKLVNRGFLIGPYCPIYGTGSIVIILLTQNINNPISIFIVSLISCSIIEYITSYLLEKIFNIRLWDYSNKILNIKGRICLRNILAFGILGVIVSYIIYPYLINILESLTIKTNIILFLVISVITIIDITLSFNIMSKLQITIKDNIKKHINTDNTDEIKKLMHNIIKQNYLLKRIIQNIEYEKYIYKIKENIKKIIKR